MRKTRDAPLVLFHEAFGDGGRDAAATTPLKLSIVRIHGEKLSERASASPTHGLESRITRTRARTHSRAKFCNSHSLCSPSPRSRSPPLEPLAPAHQFGRNSSSGRKSCPLVWESNIRVWRAARWWMRNDYARILLYHTYKNNRARSPGTLSRRAKMSRREQCFRVNK